MTTHVICNRCGKPMRPVVSYGTDEPTQGFCFCPPPVGWGHYTLAPVDWRDAELARLRAELSRLRAACQKNENDIEQILGKALAKPKYFDDQTNFPGSTDADGVCVGDHVAARSAFDQCPGCCARVERRANARADQPVPRTG